MNTSTLGRRLATCLLIVAFSALPAIAQESNPFVADDFLTPSDDVHYVGLTQLLDEIRTVEALPLKPPELTNAQWDAYGERVAAALASQHRGLKNGAMRIIIAYGDHFAFDRQSVFEVMRLYRDGDTENVRRMAVVALATMKSDFAMNYLERVVRFEKSDPVRFTIQSILFERSRQRTPL